MKKIFTLGLLCCGLFTTAQAQTEAVGINTENPQGVLHIDGASNNPASAADDVVIDASGQMGVGVAAPAAKVHIYSDTPGQALRIADGTQGDGKVLVSDADGKASWTTASGAWWHAALFFSTPGSSAYVYMNGSGSTALINYESSTISSASEGNVDAAAGTITVPFTGKYKITLSAHFISNRTGTNHYKGTVIIQLTRGGTPSNLWSPSAWGGQSGFGTNPSFSAIFNLEAGDVLRVLLEHTPTYAANASESRAFMVEFLQ